MDKNIENNSFAISEKDRLAFYLGKLANRSGVLTTIELSEDEKIGRPCYFEKSETHEDVIPIYREDILRLLSYSKRDKLCFLCGDAVYSGDNYPVFVKTRDSHDEQSNGIICNLQSGRHWNLKFPDIAWEEKIDDFFWRGADTGRVSYDNQRLHFVEKHFSGRVGFSFYEQNFKRSPDRYLKEYLLGPLRTGDVMKYKYQVVLEGNDKASNLNWTLLSNSVVIMSRPKYHSWLCEEYLVPGVHYVEVARDFSNFEQKLAWCKENDALAKEIAINGTRFVQQFLYKERETQIEKKLIESVDQIYDYF